MKIPKIIHYVWAAGEEFIIPPFDVNFKSWKEKMPEWRHIVWNSQMIDHLFKIHHPQYQDLYNSYEDWDDKKNIATLAILDSVGGIVVSLDTKCITSVDSLIEEDSDLVLTNYHDKKPSFNPVCLLESGFKYINGPYIFRGFMASIPKHPIWKLALNNARTFQVPPGWLPNSLGSMYRTGPLFLTRILREFMIPSEKTQIVSYNDWIGYIDFSKNTTPYKNMFIMLCISLIISGAACVAFIGIKRKLK